MTCTGKIFQGSPKEFGTLSERPDVVAEDEPLPIRVDNRGRTMVEELGHTGRIFNALSSGSQLIVWSTVPEARFVYPAWAVEHGGMVVQLQERIISAKRVVETILEKVQEPAQKF